MPAPPVPWKPWSFGHVVDADLPAFALRTYLEHADVRAVLRQAVPAGPVESACEVGCGYGRMTVVLGEFARRVEGFERQPEFVAAARRLHTAFTFHQVSTLGQLPAADGSFDLALTFTVLQHLTDRAVSAAVAELKRVVRPGGHILLCEETNPSLRQGDVEDEHGMCVVGRSVSAYAALLAPFRLVSVSPRHVEPTYPSKDVGHYMLFQG